MSCPHCSCPDCRAMRDPVTLMRAWCAEHGRWVSFDGMVNEATAAELLGRSEKTLRNWRTDLDGPRFVRRHGRVLYPLAELARLMPEMS